jgi:hypothetical protein
LFADVLSPKSEVSYPSDYVIQSAKEVYAVAFEDLTAVLENVLSSGI